MRRPLDLGSAAIAPPVEGALHHHGRLRLAADLHGQLRTEFCGGRGHIGQGNRFPQAGRPGATGHFPHHLIVVKHGVAMAGDGAALELEPHQQFAYPLGGLAFEHLAADEGLGHFQVHQPAQPGF